MRHNISANISPGQPQDPFSLSLKAYNLCRDKLAQLQSRMLVTCLSVLFYYYPSLLLTVLSLFSCYRIDHIASNQLYPEYSKVQHSIAEMLLN